jgi:TolB-like protein/tRNA A-37 threonylcarbamoyl transferase component Bud32/Tfp pilus assembly protein PilF
VTDVTASPFADALRDRYLIERELGRGGMATVYLARDLKHDRHVALKVLHADLAATLGPERFQREVELTARLQHPHILSVFDSGEAAGQLWYTMPFVEGESLRDRLRRESQLPVEDAIRIASEAARALDYAHQHGAVHRDIKPENLLLTKDGSTLVGDFGIGKSLSGGSDEALTQTGMAMGTPAYMSPEQASGERGVDARTDVYSLGAVLYEMLAGEPPFTGPTAQAVIAKRFSGEVASVRRVRPTVPDGIERAVTKALAMVPADRFATAAQFAAALREDTSYHPSSMTEKGAAPSIVVLPFVNLSADPDNELFSDGMTEELITALTRVGGLRVAARSSSFAFKGTAVDVRTVAERLRVRAVVEGSVRRDRNRLRVTVELVNAADGYQIWSERYDRELRDVFAVQDEISFTIAAKLKGELVSESEPVGKRYTDNLEAYQLYLRGRAHWNQRGKGLSRAVGYFQHALYEDPDYALAHTGLADSYSLLAFYGYRHPYEVFPQAQVAAERALALDPGLAEAYGSLGFIRLYYDWDPGEARRAFECALALSPGYVPAHMWLGAAHAADGKPDEAIAEANRAVTLEPLSSAARVHLAWLLHLGRHPAEAEAEALRALEIEPTRGFSLWVLGQTRLALGRPREALDALERACEVWPDSSWMAATRAWLLVEAGRETDALPVLDALKLRSAAEYVRPSSLALIEASLGHEDLAFQWLERGRAERDMPLLFLGMDPQFDVLRRASRGAEFQRAVQRPRCL